MESDISLMAQMATKWIIGSNYDLLSPMATIGCAIFRLRSSVTELSELKTEVPSFWNLIQRKTWI